MNRLISPNMLTPVLFLAICTLTAKAATTVILKPEGLLFRRDYTFDQTAGGWVKFHPMPKNWIDAALRCFREGALLASPLNEDIRNVLSGIMVKNGVTKAPIFIGIGNIYDDNEYQSMEGVPISDIDLVWSAEPYVKDSDNNNCLAMNADGTVSSVYCLEHHAFVCYRQKGVNELNKCGTVDPEYVFNPQAGSCYKVSKKALSWSEAYTSCAVDGAHLVVINSHTEAEILWELRKENIPNRPVFIGIRYWDHDWITVKGQPLAEAGYSEWLKPETNNGRGHNNCAVIPVGYEIESGVLDGMDCDERIHFICEMELNV